MKTFDIIIPHYNNGRVNGLAAACLRSIARYSSDYRVIWVQNGGTLQEPVTGGIGKCEEVKIIGNRTNVGFVRATNMGIRQSDAPFVVLMNNDTEASDGWLDKLRAPLLIDGIGMAGPLSTAAGSWQGQWRPTGGQVFILPPDGKLAFFCVMIRRDVIGHVGLLDEGFGVGLGDDDDYCQRVMQAGYRIALVQNLRIVHHHRSTFRVLFSRATIHSMQHKAVRRLREKSKQAESEVKQ